MLQGLLSVYFGILKALHTKTERSQLPFYFMKLIRVRLNGQRFQIISLCFFEIN